MHLPIRYRPQICFSRTMLILPKLPEFSVFVAFASSSGTPLCFLLTDHLAPTVGTAPKQLQYVSDVTNLNNYVMFTRIIMVGVFLQKNVLLETENVHRPNSKIDLDFKCSKT